MDLSSRRQEIIAEHQAMEKYDPYHKALADKGDHIAGRPIAFLCDDEVVVVGECVPKILDTLGAFVEKFTLLFADEATRPREYYKQHALMKCRRLCAQPAGDELRVPQQTWNAITYALGEMGVQVVLTDGLMAS